LLLNKSVLVNMRARTRPSEEAQSPNTRDSALPIASALNAKHRFPLDEVPGLKVAETRIYDKPCSLCEVEVGLGILGPRLLHSIGPLW